MATTVVLSNVHEVNGKWRVDFEDGVSLEFSSLEDLNEWVDAFDEPSSDGPQNARKMCVAYARKRSPDFSNLNSVQGKNFILDLGHGNPVRVV